MTCELVQQWLVEQRPFSEEARASMPVSMAQHVDDCPACQRQVQWEAAVHRAMHLVEIPQDLEKDLQYQLRRTHRERQRARVLYASLAAAAALLLTVCLSWYVQRPYDLAKLSSSVANLANQKPMATLAIAQPAKAQELKQWLERQGVNADIPKRLKLQFLTRVQLVEVGGRKIAILELNAGGSTSKVCLLERRYFSDKSMQQLRESENLASFIVADSDTSSNLGWMIVEPGSAHLFVEGTLNQDGA